MRILNRSQIESIIHEVSAQEVLNCIESAFTAYSSGSSQVPPVGYLGFDDPQGDVHIKYGHIANDPYYVIKVASGFYQNATIGLPTSNGIMLAFDAKTGVPVCVLQDEGYLTDLRTAYAGAVAAKVLGPSTIKRIGIVGTGIQARFQLQALAAISDCRDVLVYGRSELNQSAYIADMQTEGYHVTPAGSVAEVAATCNLIVTTTPSSEPLLLAEQINAGTHITAMGSDTEGKQELDPKILAMADMVGVDSMSQCKDHGELSHFLAAGLEAGNTAQEKANTVQEIGDLLNAGYQRSESDITVADLTGIATQDIKIASLVLQQA